MGRRFRSRLPICTIDVSSPPEEQRIVADHVLAQNWDALRADSYGSNIYFRSYPDGATDAKCSLRASAGTPRKLWG